MYPCVRRYNYRWADGFRDRDTTALAGTLRSYPWQRQETTNDNVQIRFWLVPGPRFLLDTSFRKLNKWRWSRGRRGNRGETGALVGPAARLWAMRLKAEGIARHLAWGRPRRCPRCCPRQDYNRASRIRHPLPRAHGAILSLQWVVAAQARL